MFFAQAGAAKAPEGAAVFLAFERRFSSCVVGVFRALQNFLGGTQTRAVVSRVLLWRSNSG